MEFDWSKFPAGDLRAAMSFAGRFYATIGHVSCPAFGGEAVAFNSRGLGHLLYKRSRTKEEIIERLSCLRHVREILAESEAWSDYRLRVEEVEIKKGGIRTVIKAEVCYWCFRKAVGSLILKVVVRQVGQGQKHFYSLMREDV